MNKTELAKLSQEKYDSFTPEQKETLRAYVLKTMPVILRGSEKAVMSYILIEIRKRSKL